MSWAKPKEIIPRRKKEQLLFANGVYSGGPVTVYDASPNGKVLWGSGRPSKLPNQAPTDPNVANPSPPVIAPPIKREPPELDYVLVPAKPKSQTPPRPAASVFFSALIAAILKLFGVTK